jgi:hypothetical protein
VTEKLGWAPEEERAAVIAGVVALMEILGGEMRTCRTTGAVLALLLSEKFW